VSKQTSSGKIRRHRAASVAAGNKWWDSQKAVYRIPQRCKVEGRGKKLEFLIFTGLGSTEECQSESKTLFIGGQPNKYSLPTKLSKPFYFISHLKL